MKKIMLTVFSAIVLTLTGCGCKENTVESTEFTNVNGHLYEMVHKSGPYEPYIIHSMSCPKCKEEMKSLIRQVIREEKQNESVYSY